MVHRPEEVRQRILAHATARFMNCGFSRVTMDDISRELGLSKKTLYRHFPGKQDLLIAAVRGKLAELKTRLDEAFGAPRLPFTARFDRLLHAVGVQLAMIRYPFVDDLYRHAPQVWLEIDEFRKKYIFNRLESLLLQGVREGYVRSDLNPRLVVFVITQFAQSALNPGRTIGLGTSLSEVFAAVMSLVYQGIFTEKGRSEMEKLPELAGEQGKTPSGVRSK
jgi:AcrR family transcriptional regulator